MSSIEDGFSANLMLVEDVYERYKKNPLDVDSSWRALFAQMDRGKTLQRSPQPLPSEELKIYCLITAYRMFGHLAAQTNPLNPQQLISEPKELQLETVGLSASDLERTFPTFGLFPHPATLKQILERLRLIYCGAIGIEYAGLDGEMTEWIQHQVESRFSDRELSAVQKQEILHQLNRSELFETFLHKKYTGQKRFSLEGGETLIPMLHVAIEEGGEQGIKEIVIGMAHRGRLNVLSNILNKSHADIFSEFEEGYIPNSFEGSGDVKYHKGFSAEVATQQQKTMKIFLCHNPSHLEAVDPVVEGIARAHQRKLTVGGGVNGVLPLLIHGDAAIAGQGVVYETLQLYKLAGYSTGGTIHIVVNNQIGFTATSQETRSTHYSTDIAHAFSAPVFHVNAEDPEACVYVTHLALQLRQRFGCDVFIDLNCYRKYGHNESDEPAYTQPLEYQMIRGKKPIRELYRDHLVLGGVVEREKIALLEAEFAQQLQNALEESKQAIEQQIKRDPSSLEPTPRRRIKQTAVPYEMLLKVSKQISQVPETFHLHPKLKHLVEERAAMVEQREKRIDWGTAELLAYGTLLWEGVDVRLSGQDSLRGTFSHRHAVWVDQEIERAYYPLNHLHPEQGRFEAVNSPLSEYAVLGFEVGYSIGDPEALVVWEAQFGDFCNGAQVVIDQFLATTEQKWGQKCGVTLLLPHGYEGQGPEHSSARIERFLGLAGNENMYIVNPTTPSQFFHLLRRQMADVKKRPLIVFTPKGLLRYPPCSSSIEELMSGKFEEIIGDPNDNKKVSHLFFCSGRIFYDLIAEKKKSNLENIALIRIEQLYPLDKEAISMQLQHYREAHSFFWIQEEPKNMGAWEFIHPQLNALLSTGKGVHYIGRERSAVSATGSHELHKRQHAAILHSFRTSGI